MDHWLQSRFADSLRHRDRLVEAKVFQEEEHGALFYFLRTSDDLVYVSFDYESQDLAAGGEDPMSSSFKPRTTLRIEKTPHARQLLSEHFLGDALPVPKPLPMAVRADIWPECGEFVDVAWSAIEAKYGSQRA